jgi:hypothetical protein
MQDMHPLEPAEMVEHLKQGLGKEEQVFTYITFWNLYCKQSNSLLIVAICMCRLYISKRYSLERHHLQNFHVIFQKL